MTGSGESLLTCHTVSLRLQRMDLISGLLSRGCVHILLLILSHLNSSDLSAFAEVCQAWSDILSTYFWPNRVVRHHLASNKLAGNYSAESVTLDKY